MEPIAYLYELEPREGGHCEARRWDITRRDDYIREGWIETQLYAAPSPSLGEPSPVTPEADFDRLDLELRMLLNKIPLSGDYSRAIELLGQIGALASPTAAQKGESQKQRTSELEEWVLKHPGDAAFELANYRYELAALRKKSGAQVYEALKQIVDGDTSGGPRCRFKRPGP